MYAALAQTMYMIAHQIPLFLLAFGILYLVTAFVLTPAGGSLASGLPIAALAIAASLGWFIVSGAWYGGIFIPADVLTVIGVGIVAVVLARIFAG